MNHHDANKIHADKFTRQFARVYGWLAMVMLSGSVLQAADSRPENVFARLPVLPPQLQRVAVLPLAAAGPKADLPDGCEALEPVLLDELVRTEKFEVVSVRPEELARQFLARGVDGGGRVAQGIFDSLRREYGCDAVLFCELTVYHAYAPLSVGWRLKLADARTRKIIWAADEVFDAGQPAVSRKARQFMANRDPAAGGDEIRWRLASSPRQFGSYTAAELLSRLPAR